jgi:hypothetical protein
MRHERRKIPSWRSVIALITVQSLRHRKKRVLNFTLDAVLNPRPIKNRAGQSKQHDNGDG